MAAPRAATLSVPAGGGDVHGAKSAWATPGEGDPRKLAEVGFRSGARLIKELLAAAFEGAEAVAASEGCDSFGCWELWTAGASNVGREERTASLWQSLASSV